jgi:anti-sigma regulatory factor (Ser/Thr protein kinase)
MTSSTDAILTVEEPPPFWCCQDPADAHTAAEARTALAAWLRRHCHLAEGIADDVVLAANEALANAVEHAYPHVHGEVHLAARHDAENSTLVVTVRDYGNWRPGAPAAEDRTRRRGRGLVLMRALADSTDIESTEHGTSVRMTWHLEAA